MILMTLMGRCGQRVGTWVQQDFTNKIQCKQVYIWFLDSLFKFVHQKTSRIECKGFKVWLPNQKSVLVRILSLNQKSSV